MPPIEEIAPPSTPLELFAQNLHQEVLAKCEPGLYLGEEATKFRDETWTRIQAA